MTLITGNEDCFNYSRKMKNKLRTYLPYIAWSQAVAATLGSLYFSEIAKFPPCVLCWYQRIVMYPLVWIIAVGIIKKDKNMPLYVLPFSLSGMAIAFYHVLLYHNIIPEAAAPCIQGVSCTTKFIQFFGFVTIPFLSFLGFAIISLSMVVYLRLREKTK